MESLNVEGKNMEHQQNNPIKHFVAPPLAFTTAEFLETWTSLGISKLKQKNSFLVHTFRGSFVLCEHKPHVRCCDQTRFC